jgi:hypothetical protein
VTAAAAPTLNDRQRAYLLAIFETDQEIEAAMRSLPYRPFEHRPKASEWRWLEYAEPIPILGLDGSPLWKRIKKLGLVDQGTGSTFGALADRAMVEVLWHRLNVHGQGVPHIRLTPAGRRLGWSWTGTKAYKAPPTGTLKEWHWRALAKAYAAGEEGLEGSAVRQRRLRQHRVEHLATAARLHAGRHDRRAGGWLVAQPATGSTGTRFRICITGAGRAVYEREWALPRVLSQRRGGRALTQLLKGGWRSCKRSGSAQEQRQVVRRPEGNATTFATLSAGLFGVNTLSDMLAAAFSGK